MSEFLKLLILEGNRDDIEVVNHYEFRNKPFANTSVFLAPIENFKLLTNGEDVKRIYDLKLSTKEISYEFLPGDTIAIFPQNNPFEINKLLIRLNAENIAEKCYKLEISKNTTKKNPTLPKHIPCTGVLSDIFYFYIDIRKPPKKLFLKALIPYTKDPKEVERLQIICSPKGTSEYSDLITGGAQTLLGLLDTFPTCFPPIELILEHSLPLQPRYFSVSSSPLESGSIHITFFVVENDDGTKGICTGWLEDIITGNKWVEQEIPVYFRKPNNFRMPLDLSVPIIMIATGTGLAPFKGFLDHRLQLKINEKDNMNEAFLFYGCRYSDRDFLYSKEIEGYLKNNVLTKLFTAFSRDGEEKCYVQDRINENSELVDYLLHKNAVIYVCGNMKTTVKSVKEALVNNLTKNGSLNREEAEEHMNELVKQNRFIADTWL